MFSVLLTFGACGISDCWEPFEEAAMNVINMKTTEVVFAYAGAAKNRVVAFECANRLKKKINSK